MTALSATAYSLFETAIGICGIAWSQRGVRALQLPESNLGATRGRLLDKCGEASLAAPPPVIARLLADLAAQLQGSERELEEVDLDLHCPPFHQRVYAAVRRIPYGHVLSYAEVAAICGSPLAARAVGQAMARNPVPLLVPCHRVVAAHGRTGGFTAPGGIFLKQRLLAIERALRQRPGEGMSLRLPL
jgi:methylated-DNA-[protein]-cysteine S-methyltransferase